MGRAATALATLVALHSSDDGREAAAGLIGSAPPPLARRLHRSILADKPRVTKFNINWDGEQAPSGLQSGMDVDTSS
jgi:hypothetical protein